jgi:hypothetical protein
MFPPTPDYNQQMFAYLHAWRQFLEQWAAMLPGLPFPTAPSMWPTVPFMPPMPPFTPPTPTAPAPPMPPAPGDYAQQLFSYLQAWRQYLEQMTGESSGLPQAPTTQQPTAGNGPANGKPLPPPQLDVQPESPGGSQIVSDTFGQATPLLDLPPTSGEFRSELRLPGFDQPGPFGKGPDAPQLLNPPDYAFGYRDRSRPETLAGTVVYTAEPEVGHTSEAPAQHPVHSPFSAVMGRVEPIASPQAEPRSLFSSPGAQTASPRIEEGGQTRSP